MISLLFSDCIIPGNDCEPFLNLYFRFLKTKAEDICTRFKQLASVTFPEGFSHLPLSEPLLLQLILGAKARIKVQFCMPAGTLS